VRACAAPGFCRIFFKNPLRFPQNQAIFCARGMNRENAAADSSAEAHRRFRPDAEAK
jgi:hypothetical protein